MWRALIRRLQELPEGATLRIFYESDGRLQERFVQHVSAGTYTLRNEFHTAPKFVSTYPSVLTCTHALRDEGLNDPAVWEVVP